MILDNGLHHQEGGRYSLGGMTKRLLNLELEKDRSIRTSFKGGLYSENQLRYAAYDLYAPARLWEELHNNLDNVLENIVRLEGAVIPATGSMELNGFRINQCQLSELESEILLEIEEV